LTAPNKVNYIKKNKETKFNNNHRNNAPIKKSGKSPDIPAKLSNTMNISFLKRGRGVFIKKISPQVRSNKDTKMPNGKLKINIENSFRVNNKKLAIKTSIKPYKTGENKVGKSPGLILNKKKIDLMK